MNPSSFLEDWDEVPDYPLKSSRKSQKLEKKAQSPKPKND